MTPSPTNSISDGPFQDWREPIRQSLVSPGADIRIRALSPSLSSPRTPFPFPTPSACPNGCDDSTLMSRIPAQSTVHPMHRSPQSSRRSPFSKAWAGRTVPPSPIAASSLNDRATPVQAFQTHHSLVTSPTDQHARPILTHVQPTIPPFQPSVLCSRASRFVQREKVYGKAYRNRAMTLISRCRTFVQSQEQNPASDALLRL